MMRRVSSRQRLVSWDAFDASRDSSDISDSDYSDNDHPATSTTTESVSILAKTHVTPVTTGSQSFDASERSDSSNSNRSSTPSTPSLVAPTPSQRRKRGRRKQHGPVVVPSFAWEMDAPSSSLCLLEDLVEDAQLLVLSFLDMSSLRAVLCLNHKYRSLVQSGEAALSVWKPHIQQKWPMMNSMKNLDCRESLVDLYSLPTAVGDGNAVNLALLLSMTPNGLPTEVDESLLDHPRRRSHNFHLRSHRRITHQLMRAPMPTKLQVYKPNEATGTPKQQTLVRYTGPIGSGDRCIRANHPMPRPIRMMSTWGRPKFLRNDKSAAASLPIQHHNHGSLFDLFCQGARAVSRRGTVDWRPFVAPRLQKDGTMNVTPGMVAYYEVDILEQPQDDNASTTSDDEEDLVPPFPPPRHNANTSECVAVGIAAESFHVHSRMPGWDALSFGYHGDDGGIFHSSGGMIERFGPTFGTGDTVGCGIDYIQQGIFFTLNGKFLGYGWKNIGTEFLLNDLYPVVGIDTNALIAFNFGTTKPFKFDLAAEFHSKHAKWIKPHYQFSCKYSGGGGGGGLKSLAASGKITSTGSLSSRFSRRSSLKR